MDKLIEAFTQLPMPAQIAVWICTLLASTAIVMTACICVAKVLMKMFSAKKLILIVSSIGIAVVMCVGVVATGHGGCLAGIFGIFSVVAVYEWAYWGRYCESKNDNCFDPE